MITTCAVFSRQLTSDWVSPSRCAKETFCRRGKLSTVSIVRHIVTFQDHNRCVVPCGRVLINWHTLLARAQFSILVPFACSSKTRLHSTMGMRRILKDWKLIVTVDNCFVCLACVSRRLAVEVLSFSFVKIASLDTCPDRAERRLYYLKTFCAPVSCTLWQPGVWHVKHDCPEMCRSK